MAESLRAFSVPFVRAPDVSAGPENASLNNRTGARAAAPDGPEPLALLIVKGELLHFVRSSASLVVVGLLLLACSAGSPPTTAPTSAGEIAVTLTDAMRIEPSLMSVAAGKPVTFVVTNTGVIPHEFTLGDQDVQDEHEQEMLQMGGMPMDHDHANAITVQPGETKQLVYTFEQPGTSQAGCHLPGHYPAGMMATINIAA